MEETNGKYMHKIVTIPNILSLFRLLLIPVMVWLYTRKQDPVWTTAILALSGMTDIIDGFIARKFHLVSNLGKALDPVADKLTQFAVLWCLIKRFPAMLLPLVLLVIKEAIAAVISLIVIRKTGKVYGAVWHGKVTTALLYGTMLAHLMWIRIPCVISGILIGACTTMQLLSAVLYSRQHIQFLREENYHGQ